VTIFGTADAAAKRDLLARAAALVFPIRWEEPFGMVMIGTMACDTPVVALRREAVPEVVIDGITGVLCDDPAELPAAITAARRLSAVECRAHVENCFDAATMVLGYESVYREVLRPRLPIQRSDVLVPVARRSRPTPTAATA
jgi:glycosyltransferase involved in cell wall biosynthesis